MATKKVVKKIEAPKPVAKPAGKPKAEKKSSVKLIEFGVTAVIPTQQYGNIMPSIKVQADSIEEARATVMPFIEDLYSTYAEKPRDGSKLAFLGKVTESVRTVVPAIAGADISKGELVKKAPAAPVAAPEPVPAPKAPEASDSSVAAPEAAPAPSSSPKSEFAERAEKMIRLALTEEAAEKIKTQIVNSEKIPEAEKPALLEQVEAKITDFQSNVW